MQDLATYSFANAKIRAMLSYLISEEAFAKLLDSQDMYELLELLKETPYKELLKHVSPELSDFRELEKACARHDIELFRKVRDSLSTKREKEFVELLIQRYEVDELKVILRIWHKKIPVNVEEYAIGTKISHDIDFEELLGSQTIEEIILSLDHTPYKKPLLESRDAFKNKHSIFYLEAGLDRDYYERVLRATEKFSSRDRAIAQKILGIQIDIENISSIIRLRKYHAVAVGEITPWFISGGEKINKDNVMRLYTSNGMSAIIDDIAIGPYVQIKTLIEENTGFIEQFLYQILLSQIKKSLYGFPFTIGTALGYILLKQNETKNLISLFYAKKYNWKKDNLISLLNIC